MHVLGHIIVLFPTQRIVEAVREAGAGLDEQVIEVTLLVMVVIGFHDHYNQDISWKDEFS